MSAYGEQVELIARQEQIQKELEDCGEDMDKMADLLDELQELTSKAADLDVKRLDKKIDQMMPQLGFSPDDNDRLVASYRQALLNRAPACSAIWIVRRDCRRWGRRCMHSCRSCTRRKLLASHGSGLHLCVCTTLKQSKVHLTAFMTAFVTRLLCVSCSASTPECTARLAARPGMEPSVYATCCKQPCEGMCLHADGAAMRAQRRVADAHVPGQDPAAGARPAAAG